MSVYDITLRDCLAPVMPPEKLLRLSVVGDALFVTFVKYDETAKGTKTETVETIAVSLPGMKHAVMLLQDDQAREDAREKSPSSQFGERETNLLGNRITVVPL